VCSSMDGTLGRFLGGLFAGRGFSKRDHGSF
jgi:hypothetical protein